LKAKVLGVVVIILVLAGAGAAYQYRLFNRPPTAGFEINPKYINPTDETLVRFINKSSDPDGEPLISSWFIDGKLVNSTRDHWTRLPVGNHTMRLVVSDGKAQDRIESIVRVEKSSMYPQKKLYVPLKGINYWSGDRFWWKDKWVPARVFPPRPPTEIEEDLQVIKYELGCNAIQFRGSNETSLLICAQIAARLNFSVIVLNLFQSDLNVDEVTTWLTSFAEKAQLLFQKSDSIVLSIGDESSGRYKRLLNVTWEEMLRMSVSERKKLWPMLNSHLETVLRNVRVVFKGRVTYGAGQWEEVNWSQLGFDIVGVNLFPTPETEGRRIDLVKQLKQIGKPLWVTATGCATFENAYDYDGWGWEVASNKTYNQWGQAIGIQSIMNLFNRTGIDGIFLANFKESKTDDRASFGVLRYNGDGAPFSRKLGFYVYKSYVLGKAAQKAASEPSPRSSAICISNLSRLSMSLAAQVAPRSVMRTMRLGGCKWLADST